MSVKEAEVADHGLSDIDRLSTSERERLQHRLWMSAGREIERQSQDAGSDVRNVAFDTDSWMVNNGAHIPDLNIGHFGNSGESREALARYVEMLGGLPGFFWGAEQLPEEYAAKLGLTYLGAFDHMVYLPDRLKPSGARDGSVSQVTSPDQLAIARSILSRTFDGLPEAELERVMGSNVLKDEHRVPVYLMHTGGGIAVGTGTVVRNEDIAGIWNMAVLPGEQGHRYGRRLLGDMMAREGEAGTSVIHLIATEMGKERLYAPAGFKTLNSAHGYVLGGQNLHETTS